MYVLITWSWEQWGMSYKAKKQSSLIPFKNKKGDTMFTTIYDHKPELYHMNEVLLYN